MQGDQMVTNSGFPIQAQNQAQTPEIQANHAQNSGPKSGPNPLEIQPIIPKSAVFAD